MILYNSQIDGQIIPVYFRGITELTVKYKSHTCKPVFLLQYSKSETSKTEYYTSLLPYITKIFPNAVSKPTSKMAKYFCDMCGFIDAPHKLSTTGIFANPTEPHWRCGKCNGISNYAYGLPYDPQKLYSVFSAKTKEFETLEELDKFNELRGNNLSFQF